MRTFIFLSYFTLFLTSCNKEKLIEQNFNIEIRNLGLETLDDDISNFWKFAYDEFSMKVVCGCSCSDIEKIPTIWNSGRHLLPEFVKNEVINLQGCNVLKNTFKIECNYNTKLEFIDSTINKISSISFIPEPERNLMKKFLIQVKNKTLDKNAIIQEWENLPYNDKTRNHLSLLYIQIGFSILNFDSNNPGLFEENDDVAAITHLAGAIIGGYLSVAADCVEDLYWNTGYGSGGWRDLGRSFVKGAITGAIGSI
jgi:hypothetical protein